MECIIDKQDFIQQHGTPLSLVDQLPTYFNGNTILGKKSSHLPKNH